MLCCLVHNSKLAYLDLDLVVMKMMIRCHGNGFIEKDRFIVTAPRLRCISIISMASRKNSSFYTLKTFCKHFT